MTKVLKNFKVEIWCTCCQIWREGRREGSKRPFKCKEYLSEMQMIWRPSKLVNCSIGFQGGKCLWIWLSWLSWKPDHMDNEAQEGDEVKKTTAISEAKSSWHREVTTDKSGQSYIEMHGRISLQKTVSSLAKLVFLHRTKKLCWAKMLSLASLQTYLSTVWMENQTCFLTSYLHVGVHVQHHVPILQLQKTQLHTCTHSYRTGKDLSSAVPMYK